MSGTLGDPKAAVVVIVREGREGSAMYGEVFKVGLPFSGHVAAGGGGGGYSIGLLAAFMAGSCVQENESNETTYERAYISSNYQMSR